MEDANHNEVSQVQRNQTQAYLTDGLEIGGNKKKFDKTNIFAIGGNSQIELVAGSESGESDDSDSDGDSDIISEYIGHIGPWQLFWAFIMCLYQFPTTFHIFCLVFQVSAAFESEIYGLALAFKRSLLFLIYLAHIQSEFIKKIAGSVKHNSWLYHW